MWVRIATVVVSGSAGMNSAAGETRHLATGGQCWHHHPKGHLLGSSWQLTGIITYPELLDRLRLPVPLLHLRTHSALLALHVQPNKYQAEQLGFNWQGVVSRWGMIVRHVPCARTAFWGLWPGALLCVRPCKRMQGGRGVLQAGSRLTGSGPAIDLEERADPKEESRHF